MVLVSCHSASNHGQASRQVPGEPKPINVGSQAACHQRIGLTCDGAQAKITVILNFVTLSYVQPISGDHERVQLLTPG